MNNNDKRKEQRTKFRAAVKVSHPEMGDIEAHTSDISESGAFVNVEGYSLPAIGEVLSVQVQGMGDGDAPVVLMRIARIDADGIGLEFITDKSDPE